jgi:uridine phosphorylase
LAIIFYEQSIPQYLDSLGFKPAEIKVLAIGETDPVALYIVKPANRHITPFTITGGLPGAGGVCSQAAELSALGATSIIHMGTCGFLDTTIKAGEVGLSKGSYNDGAAALLANVHTPNEATALSYPDTAFTHLLSLKLTAKHVPVKELYGVTLPIFYYQPSGLVSDILKLNGPTKPAYIEMEGAPFFQTARLGKFHSASVVMGTDYYYLKGQTVKHYFVDFNSKKLKVQVLRALVL